MKNVYLLPPYLPLREVCCLEEELCSQVHWLTRSKCVTYLIAWEVNNQGLVRNKVLCFSFWSTELNRHFIT